MSGIFRVLLVAVCVAAAAGVTQLRAAAAPAAPQQAQQQDQALIRVTARQVQASDIDLGRRGGSPGDMHVAASQVFNVRVTRRAIGSYELVCTTVRGISRSCRATLILPRGTVVFAGTMRHRPLYVLAVIGGTGLYENARGTLTVTRLGRRPVRDLLVVRLLGV